MKYILFAIAIISFASCEKKQCWQCTKSEIGKKNGVEYIENQWKSDECGYTEKGIREYETKNSLSNSHYTYKTTCE